MIMEYCFLGDLRTYLLRNNSHMSWNERVSILHGISIAISMAHGYELVHCDLHSGNILRANPGDLANVKVADLGLSRILNQPLHNKNASYGILAYMAPELLFGKPNTKATDIYAVGMIMWELSAGVPPFDDCNDETMLVLRICEGVRPQIVKGTPECWVQLMKKCWHANPSKRPSAYDICDKVQTWLQCSKLPHQFVDSTIESALFRYAATNFHAVEEFKKAEEYRKQNPHKQKDFGSMHSSGFVSWVSASSAHSQEDVIDNDEWDKVCSPLS